MKSRLGPSPASAFLVLALVIGACTSDALPAPTEAPIGSGAPSDGPSPSSAATIPQPEPPEDLEVAPAGDRVDLAMPTFTNPTEITNLLFPVSSQHSVLLLGTVEDQAFRTEVTLLPATRIIEWEGQQVETLVSQYVAFLDGRIEEVAYDLYAQADDGSVWYFGENVFNFANGVIADTHGTWIAGVDGPAAMILPADPQVGDVYRPENIPGLVFEEVTVTSTDEILDGPRGPIEGGLTVEELHMDGATEEKTFAPGYGEFYTAGGGEVEALALAVPTDAADGPTPADLERMTSSATDALAAVIAEDWSMHRPPWTSWMQRGRRTDPPASHGSSSQRSTRRSNHCVPPSTMRMRPRPRSPRFARLAWRSTSSSVTSLRSRSTSLGSTCGSPSWGSTRSPRMRPESMATTSRSTTSASASLRASIPLTSGS